MAIDTVNKIEKSQSRTALITYSESAKVVVSLANKDSSEILIAYLRNLGITGGSTDTVAALQAAYNEFNSIADRTPDTKKFLVLLTDGHSMNSLTNLTDISDQLKRTGVEMVVISAAADGGKDELEILASPKSYFLGENFETIIDRFSCAT